MDEKQIFFAAASLGHEAMVELRLCRGVEINTRNRLGETALHLALKSIRYGDEDMVKQLLSMGVNAKLLDLEGWTVLDIARRCYRDNVVITLLLTAIDSSDH